MMGGTLIARSIGGRNLVIGCRIPVRELSETSAVPSAGFVARAINTSRSHGPVRTGSRGTVLLVDNDAENTVSMVNALRRLGIEVQQAGPWSQVAILRESSADILLSQWEFLVARGAQGVALLRQQAANLGKPLRVVAMKRAPTYTDIFASKRIGVDHFIDKNAKPAWIAAMFAQWL